MTGDGETVTPLLPEPGVWTVMAQANVWAPLRWKHAKIHRGSRRRILAPHQEAGYTSAVVTVALDPVSLLQSGGVHIRPHMTRSGSAEPSNECPTWGGGLNRSTQHFIVGGKIDYRPISQRFCDGKKAAKKMSLWDSWLR
jgi:hypothetical protein